MPNILRFGDKLTEALTDADKVPARTVVSSTRPAIQADYWARLGQHPDARGISQINESANQLVLHRSREVFHKMGTIQGVGGSVSISSSTAATRDRYRFAWRSGPYAHGVGVIVGMVQPDFGTDQNSSVKLDIYSDAAMTTLVTTQTFTYGVSPQGSGSIVYGWQFLKQDMALIGGLSPDTEYYGVFSDVSYGRLQSACVFELATLSENGGYLGQNISSHSAILDTHRQYPAEILNNVLQKAGGLAVNFTVSKGTALQTITSNTPTNLIDASSTTVSAATPGYTLDMTNRARLSQTSGVPVVMKVCAKSSTVPYPGVVKLVDSGGATIMQISGSWTASPSWQSVTGYLPATQAKYDLQYHTSAGTFSVYAVSIYEYG